jgi:hypothetical protein
MLDGDLVARHDDALDEQPDETLSAHKIQLVQPITQRRGECLQILSQPLQPRSILVLRRQFLDSGTGGLEARLQPFTPGLQLVHRHGAGRVGVHEAVDLLGQLPLRLLEADTVTCPLCRRLLGRAPCLDLVSKHVGALKP